MLLELERECLEVYRRKVEEAANAKARLHHSVAAKEAELATLMAALGELNLHSPVLSSRFINAFWWFWLFSFAIKALAFF